MADGPWLRKMRRTLEQRYGSEAAAYLPPGVGRPPPDDCRAAEPTPGIREGQPNTSSMPCSLLDFNMGLLARVDASLGVLPRVVMASELGVTSTKAQRIVDICCALEADDYVSGAGGRAYAVPAQFEGAGIRVSYVDPPSCEGADLSIVHHIARLGPDAVRRMLPMPGGV